MNPWWISERAILEVPRRECHPAVYKLLPEGLVLRGGVLPCPSNPPGSLKFPLDDASPDRKVKSGPMGERIREAIKWRRRGRRGGGFGFLRPGEGLAGVRQKGVRLVERAVPVRFRLIGPWEQN